MRCWNFKLEADIWKMKKINWKYSKKLFDKLNPDLISYKQTILQEQLKFKLEAQEKHLNGESMIIWIDSELEQATDTFCEVKYIKILHSHEQFKHGLCWFVHKICNYEWV